MPKQQGKMGIKHASQCEDKKQKEVKSQGSGGFWIYTHSDWQTIGQGQKNLKEADQLLIWSF